LARVLFPRFSRSTPAIRVYHEEVIYVLHRIWLFFSLFLLLCIFDQ
jgi:hypothetical protein